MYTESLLNDVRLFTKAFLSNQLARFLPAVYVRLTRQTGRSQGDTDPKRIADYFRACLADYLEQPGLNPKTATDFLKGRRILEYGPGDILGVALLLYAHGAETVHCVDRFPMQKASELNLEVYRQLLGGLEGEALARANRAFVDHGKPESGFDPAAIAYFVTRDGLSGKASEYDLIISRAVLEHVNDLDKTIMDIAGALKPEGLSIHQVDLKSHGLDRYRPYDFLTWPDFLYGLMYGYKGFPNRWRVDKYRTVVDRAGLRFLKLVPTGVLGAEEVGFIKPRLARRFRSISAEELAWLGFWMVLGHSAGCPHGTGECNQPSFPCSSA